MKRVIRSTYSIFGMDMVWKDQRSKTIIVKKLQKEPDVNQPAHI